MRWMIVVIALWSGSAAAESPRVVADIPPVFSLVSQVMQGVGEPVLLLDGTASPHGGSLRPSQARALSGADLVVWMGATLTPWLGDAVRGQSLTLMDVTGTHILALREGGALHEDDHGHDHGHGHDDEDIMDPHAWLDPANAAVWVDAIAAELSRLDPANAATYAENAITARREIKALDARIRAHLASAQGQNFAVIHDAFHYFEDRFGLEAHAALVAGDGDRAGPKRMRAVRTRLMQGDIACLFAEPSGRVPERLIAGTDIKIARLDPLGVQETVGPDLYSALLEAMAEEIATCLK